MHHPLVLVLRDDMGPSTGVDSEKPLSVRAAVLLFGTQARQQRITNEEEAEATEKREDGKDVKTVAVKWMEIYLDHHCPEEKIWIGGQEKQKNGAEDEQYWLNKEPLVGSGSN